MQAQALDVAIRDLVIGAPLNCDVLDASGIVLLKQGLVLSQDVVDGWTKRGFDRVMMRSDTVSTGDVSQLPENARLVLPYDQVQVKELEKCFTIAKQAIDELLFQLAMKEEPELTPLETVCHTYLNIIQSDTGVLLSNAASQKIQPGKLTNNSLSTRCIQMAMLGAATAATLGLSRDECQTVAIAGLLHDMALFEETLAMLQNEYTTADERREVLFRHALHSAEMFSRCPGVTDLTRVVMTQVHEQVDGRGFPRGLPGHHLNVMARVLNVVDAYLTLTDPPHNQTAYVPSDALAYLVHHTNTGAFDRDCTKALITAASIYAVGSKVELDDASTAIVLRSSRTDPLRPIIRRDGGNEIVDLRESHLNIVRPSLDPAYPHRKRLPKSSMTSILWKPTY